MDTRGRVGKSVALPTKRFPDGYQVRSDFRSDGLYLCGRCDRMAKPVRPLTSPAGRSFVNVMSSRYRDCPATAEASGALGLATWLRRPAA